MRLIRRTAGRRILRTGLMVAVGLVCVAPQVFAGSQPDGEAARRDFVVRLRHFMASMGKESRIDAERIRRAYAWLESPYADRSSLVDGVAGGSLMRLPAQPETFNLSPRLRGAHPIGEKDLSHQALYLAGHPGALGCLLHVALRTTAMPLDVTSLVRHSEYQQALRRTNVNARTSLPVHTYGLAFDISVLNVPLHATRELAEVLRAMRAAGELYFVAEQRQFVFHVVPAPARLGFYADIYRRVTSVPRRQPFAEPRLAVSIPPERLGDLTMQVDGADLRVAAMWPHGLLGIAVMMAAGLARVRARGRKSRRSRHGGGDRTGI